MIARNARAGGGHDLDVRMIEPDFNCYERAKGRSASNRFVWTAERTRETRENTKLTGTAEHPGFPPKAKREPARKLLLGASRKGSAEEQEKSKRKVRGSTPNATATGSIQNRLQSHRK